MKFCHPNLNGPAGKIMLSELIIKKGKNNQVFPQINILFHHVEMVDSSQKLMTASYKSQL